MARGPDRKRSLSSSSFRGASKAREPGIQNEAQNSRLDSGSGADAPSRNDSDRVLVARIGAAHGVRGEVKFWSFTEDPAAVADYGPFETQDGKRTFEIEAMRAAKDHFVVRLSGVDDRSAAEKLTNTDLYVPRDRLPPIDDDGTYYHADLIGLAAVTPEGTALGKITALYNFGAGDLIEITTPQGGEPLLLPFSNAVVPEVDIKGGKVTVVLPSIIE